MRWPARRKGAPSTQRVVKPSASNCGRSTSATCRTPAKFMVPLLILTMRSRRASASALDESTAEAMVRSTEVSVCEAADAAAMAPMTIAAPSRRINDMSMRSNLGGRARYRALLALTVVACADARSDSATAAPAPNARDVRLVTLSGTRDVRESSAAVASHRQPDVGFPIDDSDNSATLFAVDTTGADRGTWRVSGASNSDWESMSLGPCEDTTRDCLYIGDTGDNNGTHPSRSIYRMDEPDAKG